MFQALSSANPLFLLQKVIEWVGWGRGSGGVGQLELRRVHWPHVVFVSSGERWCCGSGGEQARGGYNVGKESEFTWTGRLSSHCSINADILRITAAVIKGCQGGNYLLLSGLPADIPLKPISAYFNCRLLRIPFCERLIKMPLSNSPAAPLPQEDDR